ncbi:MAG: hypothetical protein LQ338_001294 [Usnochroma carphineum]|nr:MAG: hypothetical protein LQ338_001294 [Usnochroma carphineum]
MAQVQPKNLLKRKLRQQAPTAAVVEPAQQLDIRQRLALDQQQSFKFVHTLLHSSLAHLAYLRHLFPDECFKDTSFDAICKDAETSDWDYAEAEPGNKKRKSPPGASHGSEPPQDLKVLVPNMHPGVDTFLQWLTGILEGVRKRTITAAQVCICPDPTDRAKVIESYLFRFHYSNSNDPPGRQLTSLAVSGGFQHSVPVTNVRQALVELVGLISSCTKKMPDLPETRFLTCHLFHLPDLSCDLRPYGFEASSDKVMAVESSSDWRPKTIEAGSVDSGHHRVSLNITHMQRVGEEDAGSDNLYAIPDKMLHNTILSRVTGTPQAQIGRSCSPQIVTPRTRHVAKLRGSEERTQAPRDSPDSLIATSQLPAVAQTERCMDE